MNPIDKPTEHDEYNELLSVVGDIVSAGHMDQEHLARLRAHLGCRPAPAGVVREVASREGEAPKLRDHRMEKFDLNGPLPGMIAAFEIRYGQSWTNKDWRNETSTWAAAWAAAQGAVECGPSGDALSVARQHLQSSIDWMMQGKHTGACIGVADMQVLLASTGSGDALDARIRQAGALMANAMFNLAQQSHKFDDYHRKMFKKMQTDWDAAITAARQEAKP